MTHYGPFACTIGNLWPIGPEWLESPLNGLYAPFGSGAPIRHPHTAPTVNKPCGFHAQEATVGRIAGAFVAVNVFLGGEPPVSHWLWVGVDDGIHCRPRIVFAGFHVIIAA